MSRFEPSRPLRGRLTPPPDKSISHRAALFGAMSDVPVTIRNFLCAQDTISTLDAVRSLGAGVDEREHELVIRGVGLHTAHESTGGLLNVGNAGTLMRILPGWLAGQRGGQWTIDGDESIRRRPIDRIAMPLREMGARVEAREGRLAPFRIEGADLHGIEHDLPAASAQVKSCLLIAGMLAEGQTTICEPHRSRDHTERILCRSRTPFERDGACVSISQVDELELDDIVVPGDPSSAAFMVAAACVVPRSRLVIDGVGLNWTRTGFLRVARRMGAVILGDLEEPPAAGDANPADEPVGELDVAAAPLEATTVERDDVPLLIDELPLVALMGCFAEGETTVRGAGELRLKETDRIAGVVEGLRGLGADIDATGDGFAVRGGGIEGGVLDSRGDHRLAMLGAIAGLASRSGVAVTGMEAAAISYPGFERDLAALIES